LVIVILTGEEDRTVIALAFRVTLGDRARVTGKPEVTQRGEKKRTTTETLGFSMSGWLKDWRECEERSKTFPQEKEGSSAVQLHSPLLTHALHLR
jgi:hypothetical protein